MTLITSMCTYWAGFPGSLFWGSLHPKIWLPPPISNRKSYHWLPPGNHSHSLISEECLSAVEFIFLNKLLAFLWGFTVTYAVAMKSSPQHKTSYELLHDMSDHTCQMSLTGPSGLCPSDIC